MSNNNVIPAESLGQWRSWTVGELGGAPGPAPESVPDVLSSGMPEEPPAEGASAIMADEGGSAGAAEDEPALAMAVAYPTAAELEAIHQEAWQTGYEAGLQAGMQEGEAKGRSEGAAQALQEAQGQFLQYWEPLSALQQAFETELAQLGQQLSVDVLSLAVSFAEKLVGQMVAHDPAILRPLLTEALDSLSESVQQVRVQVHPEELATLQAFLGEQYPQWRMQWVPNDRIVRGGCRIEAGSTEIDLTLDDRMRRLREGLGLQDDRAD